MRLDIMGLERPTVRENVPGTAFPFRCPERHVQSDQTFCLGLRKLAVDSPEAADRWWEQLRQYIVCQSVAERTGVWPPAHELDHGAAGDHHQHCLTIARELGIEEEYASARLNEPSWITDRNLRLSSKQGLPINGRAPCPRGCRARLRPNAPVIRRKCPRRALILDIISHEKKRRAALRHYWKAEWERGTRCCGSMLNCELKKIAAANVVTA